MCTIIYYVKQLVLLFFIFIISVCSTQDPWRVSGSMSNNTKKKIIRKAFFFRKNIFQLKYLIFLFFIFLPRVIIRNHFSDLLPVCCCALFFDIFFFNLWFGKCNESGVREMCNENLDYINRHDSRVSSQLGRCQAKKQDITSKTLPGETWNGQRKFSCAAGKKLIGLI